MNDFDFDKYFEEVISSKEIGRVFYVSRELYDFERGDVKFKYGYVIESNEFNGDVTFELALTLAYESLNDDAKEDVKSDFDDREDEDFDLYETNSSGMYATLIEKVTPFKGTDIDEQIRMIALEAIADIQERIDEVLDMPDIDLGGSGSRFDFLKLFVKQ